MYAQNSELTFTLREYLVRRSTISAISASAILAAAALFSAVPAHAAASGSLSQTGGGTTVTPTYSGVTAGNVLFCSTSIAASSCGFMNYTYLMGGFGVAMPSSGSAIGVGSTVYARSTASTTTLPDGTYSVVLAESGISFATLDNGVIGTGVTPSGGSDAATGVGPTPIIQQFGKPVSATCDATAPQSLNWSGVASGGWSETWGEWMNDGKGGAVCSRMLVYSVNQAKWIIG
jgi:hypothetical protein